MGDFLVLTLPLSLFSPIHSISLTAAVFYYIVLARRFVKPMINHLNMWNSKHVQHLNVILDGRLVFNWFIFLVRSLDITRFTIERDTYDQNKLIEYLAFNADRRMY